MKEALEFFEGLSVCQLENLHKEGYDFIISNGSLSKVEKHKKCPVGRQGEKDMILGNEPSVL